MFRVTDLNGPYRFIVALAAGQVLAAVLLILSRDRFPSTIAVAGAAGASISPVSLGLSLFLIIAGLTYILYASAFVRPALRLALFAAYALVLAFPIVIFRGRFVSPALIMLLVISWATVLLHKRSLSRSEHSNTALKFHIGPFAALFVFVACAFTLPMWDIGVPAATGVLNEQISAVAILIVPALLMAGADLAEIAQVTAEYAGAAAAQNRVLTFAGTAALALVPVLLAPRLLVNHSARWILNEVALIGLFGCAAAFALRSRGAASTGRFTAKLAAIAAVTIFALNLMQSIIFAAFQVHRPIYVTRNFRMEYPPGWSAQALGAIQGGDDTRAYRFSSPDAVDFNVMRGAAGWHFLVTGAARSVAIHRSDLRFMQTTFRAGAGQSNPYLARSETIASGAGLVLLAIFLTALTRQKKAAMAVLFAAFVAFAWTFYHPVLFTELLRMPEALSPIFDMHEIQMFVAVFSLGALTWFSVRRTHMRGHATSLLLELNLALAIIVLLYDIYGSASSLGEEFSIVQGVIVLLALSWESVMSGESFTNGHTAALPRSARICMFFGYIVLVSAVVVFLSSMHFGQNGERIVDSFESEFYPQRAMLLLGVPMILAQFTARFAHLAARGRTLHA